MTYNWPKLDSAIAFAATAHAGQTRKYNGLPYIVHPIEVMEILWRHADVPPTEDMLVAAVLHDVIEDTVVGLVEIERRYGPIAAGLVDDLTERKVEGNRKFRKDAEAERLKGISRDGKIIKLADLISNTKSIVEDDPDFGRTYLQEKAKLLDEALFQLNPTKLWNIANDLLMEGMIQVGLGSGRKHRHA